MIFAQQEYNSMESNLLHWIGAFLGRSCSSKHTYLVLFKEARASLGCSLTPHPCKEWISPWHLLFVVRLGCLPAEALVSRWHSLLFLGAFQERLHSWACPPLKGQLPPWPGWLVLLGLGGWRKGLNFFLLPKHRGFQQHSLKRGRESSAVCEHTPLVLVVSSFTETAREWNPGKRLEGRWALEVMEMGVLWDSLRLLWWFFPWFSQFLRLFLELRLVPHWLCLFLSLHYLYSQHHL